MERLKKAFRDEGCLRQDLRNHIPAVIEQQNLDAALRNSDVSTDRLRTNPHDNYVELEFPLVSGWNVSTDGVECRLHMYFRRDTGGGR